MNRKDVKRVGEIADLIESSASAMEHTLEELASLAHDEEITYDELGDKAKEGERGQKIQARAEALQSASDKAQEGYDSLIEAVNDLKGIE